MSPATAIPVDARVAAAKFIEFLETNSVPEGLFAADVFADVTLPQWRLQADSVEGLHAIRVGGHPIGGRVPRHRLDAFDGGFVLEFEERWTDGGGEDWYCREMIRADTDDAGLITQLSVYCTGDWDSALVARHAAEVALIRP